jgi:hypothetical protein
VLTRIRKHLNSANVIAVIALFVALGGGAYAAKKLNGKTIKNNSIPAKKLKKGVLKNLDKCPAAAPNKVAGICYAPASSPTNWDTANQAVCPPQKLRAPTIGEALLVMNAVGGGPGNETWTDEVTDLSPASQRGLVKAPGDPSGQIFTAPVGSSHAVRCVINATN